MKRKLLKQMRNEWRENLWLVMALTIVCLSVWSLFLILWGEIEGVMEPLGFEAKDVYTLKLEMVPEDSPEYNDYGEEKDAMEREDRVSLMRQIRGNVNVEAAAWSSNFIPYDFSYWGASLNLADGEVDSIGYSANIRRASPDIAKVLRLRSHSGKSPEQLAEMLSSGDVLVANSYGDEKSLSPESLLGRVVILSYDSLNPYRVGDVIDNVRRSDYEMTWGGMAVIPVDDENPGQMWDIILRLKPGKGAAFAEELDNTPAMQQHRNFYFSNLKRLEDLRDARLREPDANVKTSVGLMIVFLAVILLGLLGTFWFRVQQRVGEIAIRKVCGASKGAVFTRIISEGILLLVCAGLISIAVVFFTVRYGSIGYMEFETPAPIILSGIVTILLVGSGVVLSIGYPAWRAMRIEPAIAVKSE